MTMLPVNSITFLGKKGIFWIQFQGLLAGEEGNFMFLSLISWSIISKLSFWQAPTLSEGSYVDVRNGNIVLTC